MLRLPGLFCTSLFLNVTVELGCSNHVENNVFMGLIDLFLFLHENPFILVTGLICRISLSADGVSSPVTPLFTVRRRFLNTAGQIQAAWCHY